MITNGTDSVRSHCWSESSAAVKPAGAVAGSLAGRGRGMSSRMPVCMSFMP
jgi:hypothetical protein